MLSFTKLHSAMKPVVWQAGLAEKTISWYRYPILFFHNRRRPDMDCSFPRACEVCGQESGVGFKDGQWRCDACLEGSDIPDGSDKPSRSRRIFVTGTMLPAHMRADTIVNRPPPIGERAAKAVLEDRGYPGKRPSLRKPAKKNSAGSIVQEKARIRRKKKRTSRP